MGTMAMRGLAAVAVVIGAVVGGLGCSSGEAGTDAEASDQALAQAQTQSIPAFADSNAPATKVDFLNSSGQPSAQMHGPSAGLEVALKELNRQGEDNNESYTAATFKFAPNEAGYVLDTFDKLNKGQACNLDPLMSAFQAMFLSLEPKRDGEDAHTSLDQDTMSCQRITAQAATSKHRARSLVSTALATFRGGAAYAALVDPDNDPKISSANLAKLVSASNTAVRALLNGSNDAAIYACDWSNSDDEDGSAILAVNKSTGELRVLFGYVGP